MYKHLAEFWMIEPEFAFADINDNIRYAVNFIKFCVQKAIACCPEDIAFFDKQSEGLLSRLREIVDKEFTVLTYTEAVDIICKAQKAWVLKPEGWGADLASEHERYLTDEVFKGPVVVINYPKAIKSFYMRQNEGCAPGRETVAAMDVLLPRVGEIIGGSQREERLDHLQQRMAEVGIGKESLQWYLDLRRFGTVPHAGFGLGFERLVMICTGLENIRDSIPFPRYPGHCNF
jgi:asparaginyl-tRNA synthetase